MGASGLSPLKQAQEELEDVGSVCADLLPALPPPLVKWPLFKNTHNVLIFRVVHVIFTACFVKNSVLRLKGLLFFLTQKKKSEEQDIPFVKKQLFLPLDLLMGLQLPFNYKIN